jgi:hypothetical protein
MLLGSLPTAHASVLRLGQVSSADFVGCVKSLSVNGFEKNIIADSLNRWVQYVILVHASQYIFNLLSTH